jgi:hypothetical protein
MIATTKMDSNAALYALVAKGDKAAREEMITNNMPLVLFKVDSYLACFPHLAYLRDDLVGEGNLELVVTVNRINGGIAVDYPTGYLSVAIQMALGRFIDNELYSSDRSARRSRSSGDELESLHKVPNSDFVIGELEFDPRKEADLLELIVGCCESEGTGDR